MKVLLVQPPYPGKDEELQTLAWQKNELDKLGEGEYDLILLPENSNCSGPCTGTREGYLSFIRGPGMEFVEQMKSCARRTGSTIMAGVAEVGSDGIPRNRLMVMPGKREPFFGYTKTHLVKPELDKGIEPGKEAGIFELDGVRYGAAICYDCYFPEYFALLASYRPEVVLMASHQRADTPERLTFLAQARAFDTGSFVLRASPAMKDPRFGGTSLAVSPEGTVLAGAEKNVPCVIPCEINPHHKLMRPASYGELNRVVDYRELLQGSRRSDLYRKD